MQGINPRLGQSGLVMCKEILARSLTGMYRGLRDSNQKG